MFGVGCTSSIKSVLSSHVENFSRYAFRDLNKLCYWFLGKWRWHTLYCQNEIQVKYLMGISWCPGLMFESVVNVASVIISRNRRICRFHKLQVWNLLCYKRKTIWNEKSKTIPIPTLNCLIFFDGAYRPNIFLQRCSLVVLLLYSKPPTYPLRTIVDNAVTHTSADRNPHRAKLVLSI